MALNQIAQTFASRVRQGQKHTADALSAIENIAQVHDRMMASSRRLEQDRNLTTAGRANALANLVNGELARDLARASRPARRAPAYLRSERASLGLPKADKSDVVEAMKRTEVRSYVASLPNERRMEALADVELRDAILDAPAPLSGIPKEVFERAKQARIREIHGAKIDELDGALDDYANVVSYASMLKAELQKSSGLSAEGFAAMMQPLEQEADK